MNSSKFILRGNYIKIEGFRLRYPSGGSGWTNAGVTIDSDSCIVQNNDIDNMAGQGIILTANADNCTVDHNVIARAWAIGIAVNGGSNNTVSYNDISDIRCLMGGFSWDDANGIDIHGDGHRFIGNYPTHDITFVNNPGYNPHIDAFQTYIASPKPAGTNLTFDKNRINLMQQGLDPFGDLPGDGWLKTQLTWSSRTTWSSPMEESTPGLAITPTSRSSTIPSSMT